MALFKPMATKYGDSVSATYHRVESPAIIEKDKLSFVLASFSENPLDLTIDPFVRIAYVCDYDLESSENPFQQGYAHIKALPEWSGAVDC